MSNEVSQATKNFFEKYGEAATQRNIVGDLLLFTKFGEWVHGRDRALLPKGTVLAAHMQTLTAGWICWQDGQIADQRMGPVRDGFVPPKREELGMLDQQKWDSFDDGKPSDPWRLSNNLVMSDLETEALFTFSTSSKGGLSAIGELCKVYGKRVRSSPNEVPSVEFGMSSYQHPDPKVGEVRIPVLKIVGWIATDKLPLIDGGDETPQSEPPLALPEPLPFDPPKPQPAAPKAHPRTAI